MEPNAPAQNPAEAVSTAPNPEKAAAAKELVEGILTRMGVTAELKVDDRADGIHLAIEPKSGGEALGTGRRGGVVESITYLVNKAINRDEVGRKWVFLEVAGELAQAAGGETSAVEASQPVPAAEIDAATRAIAE